MLLLACEIVEYNLSINISHYKLSVSKILVVNVLVTRFISFITLRASVLLAVQKAVEEEYAFLAGCIH